MSVKHVSLVRAFTLPSCLALCAAAAFPALSFAAAHYDSDEGGWICSHGYNTFSDKRLTGGCSNVTFWFASGDYSRDGLKVTDSILTSGAKKWSDSDSSISFTKAEKAKALITFARTSFSGDILAQTHLYTKDGTELIPTKSSSLTSNYKTARIYTSENKMGLCSKADRIGTISHELGHALGLSHRNKTSSSIMCQLSSRTAKEPAAKDVKTVKHVY